MNKKIFTLLAGAFLMFATVFSVNAQGVGHGLWDESRLKLAEPVGKLSAGVNRGYYHLKVDSVHSVNPANSLKAGVVPGPGVMNDTIVLFMGREINGQYNLFIDTLTNYAGPNAGEFKSNPVVKAEASAASLWCVTVNPFNQGQNVTFDFVNKEQEQMLEVDLFNYESWPSDFVSIGGGARVGSNLVPGGVSAWEFSTTYATGLDSLKPLISYIDEYPDSVAVLCIDDVALVPAGAGGVPKVVVKIAAATDVQNGNVEGVLYFTLTEAAPFIINAEDFNTKFGKNLNSFSGASLNFNPNVKNGGNPFTDNVLEAQYLEQSSLGGVRIDILNWDPNASYREDTIPNFSAGGQWFIADSIRPSMLDSLGYMWLKKKGTSQYLEVATKYLTGNVDPYQYLTFNFTANGVSSNPILFGQSAFRLVYYPSGDSIYINPYQATYLPLYDNQGQNSLMSKFQISANGWTDSVTQAVFTYFADTMALENPDPNGNWATGTIQPGYPLPDLLDMITARLKSGFNPLKRDLPTNVGYYHRLYVALQDLTGDPRVTLHTNNKTMKDGQINTQINFGIYAPCIETGGEKTTIDADLYLIRNEKGQYLFVPLHSATDSASWVTLEADVHPELIPSFQWVVQKRYPSSDISPITITNREFDWLEFTAQLDTVTGRPFNFRTKRYDWNTEPVNANTVAFGKHDDTGFEKSTFISLPKKYKEDSKLGYTWIDPDTSVVSLYAFNYANALSSDFYLGVNNYPTDTLIYTNREGTFDKMYFFLDTIHENGYGELQPYGYKVNNNTQVADLVTLERQAYRLTYKDPFKMNCANPVSIANGEDKNYVLRPRGAYRDIFGKPAFYLRNMFHEGESEVPCFTLVQRIDTTTWHPNPGVGDEIRDRFEKYLKDNYGSDKADIILKQLDKAGQFNEGLFVAKVEDNSSELKMDLRVNASAAFSYSTFKLERDDDPIYRRFNTTKEGAYATDAPDTVHFYMPQESDNKFLFENTGAIETQRNYYKYTISGVSGELGGKNYLGWVSLPENPNAKTAIFVDTAYINRGTGYIKPQYLLMVDPKPIQEGMGCDEDGNETIPLPGYIRGRYLINAHDSIYNNGTGRTDYNYVWHPEYTRLVFTDAIHVNDHLYILGEYGSDEKLKELGLLANRVDRDSKVVDIEALHKYATGEGKGKIHAIYLGTNTHKDCVFQFRLIERNSDDFLIESQTTDRDTVHGPMIAPCEGGWVKIWNNVPVISTTDTYMNLGQSASWNVFPATREGYDPNPTDNENVVAVSVIGNEGAVSILNAAGKKVIINNILGQTVASTVLTSDNETITAPKGVVIVSIEGEEAVKTLVK